MGANIADSAASSSPNHVGKSAEGAVTPGAVRNQIALLANQIADIALELITESATIDNELQMQSVALVELQVALEEEYGIELDPIRIIELNRFDAIVQYVYEKALAARA